MKQTTFTRSFAGGELSAQLFGRLDLAKFQTGLAKCLNFEVTAQGPVENRAGFEYVLKTKGPGASVLIPFSYNSVQTFSLEFGDQYVRFHTNGATLLEAAKVVTAVTNANPGVFGCAAHGYAVGEWVYLAGMGGMADLTPRWGIVATVPGANTFTLTDLFGAAIDTTAMGVYTGGGTVSRVYEVATPYVEADLFNLHYVQSADVLTICHENYAPRELKRLGATNWTLTAIAFGTSMPTPATPTATPQGPGGGTPTNYAYLYTVVKANTLEESLQSGDVTAAQDLTVNGNSIVLDTSETPASLGGIRFNVYKYRGVPGYIGSVPSDRTSFIDDNIEPDTSKTPPLSDNPFATNNPRAVSYYEQRRCFGGSSLLPQTFWATRSATEANMNYSIPTQDDDPITARIVAREANTIRHLVPLGDLLALTSGGVWRISSANSDVLTPLTFSVRPQSYVGASNVQPVVTNMSVLYAPDRGAHIREVAYQWQAQAYQASDVSVLAPHLFDFHTIVQLAYTKSPTQTLWAVREDGLLLGLTYLPEHDVRAWHQHNTRGTFESVCSVAEGDEDGTYAIIKRTINGHVVRYIERKHSRQFTDLADAFFVDSGLTYSGAPVSEISGLWHLEGESSSILADGGVSPPQVVTNGKVALDAAASKVHVGLAYDSDFQTMPLAFEVAGFGQGNPKNINKVQLRVYRSSGIHAGPTFEKLTEYAQRTSADPYGAPPTMLSDIVDLRLTPTWQDNGQVCVRQSDPVPLTIEAMTLETATGG